MGSNSSISGEDGDDYIVARNNNNSINGGSGDDNIVGEGSNITILGENGNDTVYVNDSNYAFIDGSYGVDSLVAGGIGRYSDDGGIGITINGGEGNDYLRTKNNTNGSMIGGSGDDTIVALGSPQNITIMGGWGNDSISLASEANAFVYFNSSDDYDIVYGFNEDDSLLIAGSYSTVASDNNVIVTAGSGKVILVNATSYSLNIQSTSSEETVPTPTLTTVQPDPTPTSDDYYVYSGGYATISAGTSTSGSVSSSYQTYNKVKLATNLSSFDIDSNNIYLRSNTGTLTIQNARGKHINYYYSDGQLGAYSYLGANEVSGSSSSSSVSSAYSSYSSVDNSYNRYNTIDERNHESVYGVLVGGNNVNDIIYAGSGGASLWGGTSGNDTLVGGAGYDEFVYRIGSGNDVIKNFSNSDLVNLEGISLSQITSANVTSNEISAQFVDGGTIKIQGSASVGIKVDGVVFAVNHATNTWFTK